MEIQEIRYFIALSQTLNFTKAAAVCNVSQPGLTRAIQKMEDELGGLLFSRERNNTHLTALGRLIAPHLAEVIARTGEAKQAAARFLKLEKASFALGVMCTIAPIQFISFMARFRAENPGIEITLVEAVPDRLSDLLVRGELDIALMARPGGFPAQLQSSILYTERFVIACSAGHRFAMQSSLKVAELDGEIYLSRINCEYRDVLLEICESAGASLVRAYRSEREDWILTMVAGGMGISFLPEYTAIFPGVVGRAVEAPSLERNVSLVTVAGRRWSPAIATFVSAVQRYPWGAAAMV